MELKQYWNLFWKRKWLIVLSTLLVGGAAFLVGRNTTPVYRVTTRLLVSTGSPESSESYSSLVAGERLAQTYARILLESQPLMEETLERLGPPETGEAAAGEGDRAFSLTWLLDRLDPWVGWMAGWLGVPLPRQQDTVEEGPDFTISAELVSDTQLITVRVEGPDPERITRAANILVQAFIEWQERVQKSRYSQSKANLAAGMQRVEADIKETEAAILELEAEGNGRFRSELARLRDRLVRYRNSYSALLESYSNINLAEANSAPSITVVSAAERPKEPIRPRVMRDTLLAVVVGGILAVSIAFLIEYLDDTIKSFKDLETADLTLLAAVHQASDNSRNGGGRLFAADQPKSLISESFRTLRTNLQFSSLDRPLRSLVVTSAVAGEGKTTTAANLAVVMAQDGKKVAVVDADLRRPNLHTLFDMPNRTGLTMALVDDQAGLNSHMRDTGIENLRVLAAGPIPPNPQEMLGSQRMAQLVQQLLEDSDIVILDAPPALAVADANVLASQADGVLLVVNTNQTPRMAVLLADEGLRKVGARVMGAFVVDDRGKLADRASYFPDDERPARRHARRRAPRWRIKLRRLWQPLREMLRA